MSSSSEIYTYIPESEIASIYVPSVSTFNCQQFILQALQTAPPPGQHIEIRSDDIMSMVSCLKSILIILAQHTAQLYQIQQLYSLLNQINLMSGDAVRADERNDLTTIVTEILQIFSNIPIIKNAEENVTTVETSSTQEIF